MADAHRVVVVGGGFGGLSTTRGLAGAPAQVTLVDRRNFHLFQPLLYQVATAGLSPANIAAPLRAILKRQRNARVLLGEVVGFDVPRRRVLLRDGNVPYDTLVVAAGAGHHYFGHDEWAEAAPGLKSLEDALKIRTRILLAFERAEREADPAKAKAWLSLVVVGGGSTGVELAGAVAEIARDTLRSEFRHIDPAGASITLLEGADRLLPTYPPELSEKARRSLAALGVDVRTRATVTRIDASEVCVETGGGENRFAARTVLWAAGVRASPLGRTLATAAGAEVDGAGRIVVGPDLSLPGHPEILVLGDLALCRDRAGRPLPGVAPVAMQQGNYAAALILARLRGGPSKPFRYRNYGNLATIGRAAAVADFGPVRFSGYLAWLAWLFIHLMKMVVFENRLLVFVQWAWNYFTRNRAARLITGEAGEAAQEDTP